MKENKSKILPFKKHPLKIRIGIPSYSGKITETTKKSLDDVLQNQKKYGLECEIFITSGGSCCIGRNRCITQSQKIKQSFPFDYYFSIDADMGFNINTLQKLLSYDQNIVGGAYLSKESPNYFTAGYFTGIAGDAPIYKRISSLENKNIHVDWTGGGAILIKREVLEKMEFPYFRNNLIKKDDSQDYTTEDIGFCMEAKKAGFKIFFAGNVPLVHSTNEGH